MLNAMITQSGQEIKREYTGIVGVSLGMYEVYIQGEFILNLFSDNYQAALVEFHQILEDYSTIRLLDSEKDDATHSCPHCGKWNRIDSICDHTSNLPEMI